MGIILTFISFVSGMDRLFFSKLIPVLCASSHCQNWALYVHVEREYIFIIYLSHIHHILIIILKCIYKIYRPPYILIHFYLLNYEMLEC